MKMAFKKNANDFQEESDLKESENGSKEDSSLKKRQIFLERPSKEKKSKERKLGLGPSVQTRSGLTFEKEWKERVDFVSKLRGLKKKKIKSQTCSFSIDDLKNTKNKIFSVDGLSLWGKEDLIVQDKNGETIFYYLNDGLRRPFKDRDPSGIGLAALEKFTEDHPPPPPKKTDVRHKSEKKHHHGHGVHHLALWHGIGHKKNPVVASKDIIGAGWKLNAVMAFLRDFTPVIQSVGALFFALEQKKYESYKETFNKYVKHGAGKVLQNTERNCFVGMAILTGLCCKPHRDSTDALDGWVADFALGEFEGGYLQVPQIGYEFVMKQGTIVFMKSALLQHYVLKVTLGKRYAVVCFSHEANFQETFKN